MVDGVELPQPPNRVGPAVRPVAGDGDNGDRHGEPNRGWLARGQLPQRFQPGNHSEPSGDHQRGEHHHGADGDEQVVDEEVGYVGGPAGAEHPLGVKAPALLGYREHAEQDAESDESGNSGGHGDHHECSGDEEPDDS